ncbi:MAG: agmatine deiminase family protein [Alphaproteobacteria bacterium]|nr:agmatine deiminase family protein [Alphaproteobacteria bacterium]
MTTRNDSFHMPAEWAPQERIWLSWPHARGDWPGKFAPIPWVFAEMVRAITPTQRVGVLVNSPAVRAEAMDMLDRAGVNLTQVDFLDTKTNRGWLRDCGPIWVRDTANQLVALDWKFTGWAKYTNHRLDNHVPESIAHFTQHTCLAPHYKGKPVVLEGGGIEVDGAGSVLVTEEWLLSDVQVRNPGLTRDDYEAIFAQYLGASRTIWLEAGIVGDDTHGHIDDITRFVAPGSVVTVMERDHTDANYALLQANRARLARTSLNITELPMPRPVIFEGQRLPASYANFLICNKVVLVPVFNDPADAVALAALQKCFPTRDVVGIYARDLVWGLGTLHCLTQQQPA